jgi:hypothetical protein
MKTKDQIKNTRTNRAIVFLYEKGYSCSPEGTVFNERGKEVGYDRGDGRYCIGLNFEGSMCLVLRSRFVAYCKYKDLMFEPGILVRHIDDNSSDDSLNNIRIGTKKDNIEDARRNNIKLGRPNDKDRLNYSSIYVSWKTVGFSNTMRRFNMSTGTLTKITQKYEPTLMDKANIFWKNLI